MGIMSLIQQMAGSKLPDSFVHDGRRYPLYPVYDHIERDPDAQAAVLEMLRESIPAGGIVAPDRPPGGDTVVDGGDSGGDEEDSFPPPLDPVEYPSTLHVRATGGRYPGGRLRIEPERFAKWLRSVENINTGSRVWFDATPNPDTVKAIPEMLDRVSWTLEQAGSGRLAIFRTNGETVVSPRPGWLDRRIIVGTVEGDLDAGFTHGVFRQDYVRSRGYFVPIKFNEEGVYNVRCEVTRPDGKTLFSNELQGLRIS